MRAYLVCLAGLWCAKEETTGKTITFGKDRTAVAGKALDLGYYFVY